MGRRQPTRAIDILQPGNPSQQKQTRTCSHAIAPACSAAIACPHLLPLELLLHRRLPSSSPVRQQPRASPYLQISRGPVGSSLTLHGPPPVAHLLLLRLSAPCLHPWTPRPPTGPDPLLTALGCAVLQRFTTNHLVGPLARPNDQRQQAHCHRTIDHHHTPPNTHKITQSSTRYIPHDISFLSCATTLPNIKRL
jgi:hypothetical protein